MSHDSNKQELEKFVAQCKDILDSDLEKTGLVIYSDRNTLRPNPVLFYGINPGQDPKNHHHTHWSIEKSLNEFASGHPSLITHQAWPKRKVVGGTYVNDYEPGQAPYQRRTQHLLNEIGHSNALVTNLLFLQSRGVQELGKMQTLADSEKLLASCWQVHELILEICRPEVIITCTTAVDRCMGEKFELREESHFPAMHVLNDGKGKDRQCTVFTGNWKERALTVVAIPHMSYYAITSPHRKAVVEKLKSVVKTATNGRPI